ncbi:amidase [Legionella israelensis]|uniref:amidase n=1 Tax=Legionella israelensis TaxID=454 RepID=UPI001181371B|nr:amidase [Legionella israelensis]QDP71653.1 amidase [Legionella israelensis]
MRVTDYLQYDAHDLAELIKKKKISAHEVLDCAIARLQEVNGKLNAIVTDCSDFAKAQLQKLQGTELLYGVPVLIKDLGFSIAGIRDTAGSKFFSHNIGQAHSDFIQRLLNLGCLPLAKTNIPELGLSYVTEPQLFGPCRNPYDLERTAGGSSGGSAAAVAAGIAPIATASDGGGSIRIPAACCGLIGFKPSKGLMPTGPWIGESWSGLAASHVLTRSLRDSELLFHLMSELDLKRPQYSSLTIARLKGAFAPVPVHPACLKATQKIEELLKQLGHQIHEYPLNLDLEAIGECTLILIAANTCAEIELQQSRMKRKAKNSELEPVTWEFFQRGKKLSATDLIQAKNRLYQLTRPVHQLLMEADIILTPALAQLPLFINELKTDDEFERYLQKNLAFSPFTSLFNQAGLPAMSFPVLYHEHLPVSVQIATAHGKDALLFTLAREIQSLLPDFSKAKSCIGKSS